MLKTKKNPSAHGNRLEGSEGGRWSSQFNEARLMLVAAFSHRTSSSISGEGNEIILSRGGMRTNENKMWNKGREKISQLITNNYVNLFKTLFCVYRELFFPSHRLPRHKLKAAKEGRRAAKACLEQPAELRARAQNSFSFNLQNE